MLRKVRIKFFWTLSSWILIGRMINFFSIIDKSHVYCTTVEESMDEIIKWTLLKENFLCPFLFIVSCYSNSDCQAKPKEEVNTGKYFNGTRDPWKNEILIKKMKKKSMLFFILALLQCCILTLYFQCSTVAPCTQTKSKKESRDYEIWSGVVYSNESSIASTLGKPSRFLNVLTC